MSTVEYRGYGIQVSESGGAHIISTPSGRTDVTVYSDFTLAGLKAKLDRLAEQGIGEEHVLRDTARMVSYSGDGHYQSGMDEWDGEWL